jgi:hypothetical protein
LPFFNPDLVGSTLGAFFHEAQGIIPLGVDSSAAALAFRNRRPIHDSELAGIARPDVTPRGFHCGFYAEFGLIACKLGWRARRPSSISDKAQEFSMRG